MEFYKCMKNIEIDRSGVYGGGGVLIGCGGGGVIPETGVLGG